jgi:hypothetical protein
LQIQRVVLFPSPSRLRRSGEGLGVRAGLPTCCVRKVSYRVKSVLRHPLPIVGRILLGVNPTRRVDVAGGVRASGLAEDDGETGLQVEQVARHDTAHGLRHSPSLAVVGVVGPGEVSHPVGAIPGGSGGQVAVGVVGRAASKIGDQS